MDRAKTVAAKGSVMKTSSLVRGLGGLAAVGLLSACELTGTETTDAPPAAEAQGGTEAVERETDVDAPALFSAKETGLWDGRPSFGGVWVAHPDATQPERVRITNVSTGKTIAGALFRRERDFPGPRIQISSNAAAALGILAGQPTELQVIALRRETVTIAPATPKPAPEPEVTEEVIEAAPEVAESKTEPTEADGTEAAALTPAELRKKKRQEAAAKRKAEREARIKAREEERARIAAEKEAKKQAEAEARAAAEAAATAQAAAEKAATRPEARPASSDPIAAAAAALDSVENDSPAAVEGPKPPRAPFAQVGVYQTREEADQISAVLSGAGLLPTVVERRFLNQITYRIIVGPAQTQSEYDTFVAQLSALGYDGVKPVRR